MMRRAGWVIAAMVLVALLVVAVRRIDMDRLILQLRSVRVLWLVAAMGCYVAILPLWALLWRILAPPAEHNTVGRMLGVVAMASSTLHTTAFLVGEAAGITLLVTRVGLSRSAALSVMAMDQLLVGITKLVVLATGALTLTLPRWMSAGVVALSVVVPALLGGCLLTAWRHKELALLAARFVPERAARAIATMGEALAPLRSPARAGGALLLALAKKVVEVMAILCVQRAFGISLPLASGVLVLAALNVATLIPLVPGNFGVYEGAVVLTYTHLGLSPEQAAGIAVVQHACYFAALALPGYAWLAARGVSRTAAAAS